MYETLKIMGYTTNLNWLAGFLNHQQKQTHRRLDIDMHEKAQVLQPQVFFWRQIMQGHQSRGNWVYP